MLTQAMRTQVVADADHSRGRCGSKPWPMRNSSWPMRTQVVADAGNVVANVDGWPMWDSSWPMRTQVVAEVDPCRAQ